jgi:putative ABC transport system permease protein
VIPFLAVRLAAREGRAGARRIGVFMGAIALGVGALTGLHAFQQDASEGVRAEAQALMGGDLRIQSGAPLTDAVVGILDSLRVEGFQVARAITLASSVPSSSGPRLVQLNAVDDAFPLTGRPAGDPPGTWAATLERPAVAADVRLLRQLGVAPGDTLRLGQIDVEVAGGVTGLPVDFGPQSLVGPPLFVSLRTLEASGLLGFGSLAQFRAFLNVPAGSDPAVVARSLTSRLQGEGASIRTARAEAESLAQGFRSLSSFLGLVGLMALLLGGIGVASAVHVYVRERTQSIAVLRCLGAREGTVFRVYLLQALALGLAGSAVGIVLGLGLQFTLPRLLAEVLPFDAAPRLRPVTLLAGLALGSWIALLFALIPLLRVREVPPLAALRADVEASALRRVVPRLTAGAGLALTLFLVSAAQVGGVLPGAVFAGALGAVLLVLGGLSLALAAAARRLLPPGAPFAVRQGVAGLFRPGNQTGAVLTAMGFGAFLIGSLLVAESGLRSHLAMDPAGGEPSIVLFDVQTDQREQVEAVLADAGARTSLVPLVPARLATIAGVPVEERVADGSLPGWVGRRVYRNTWRDALTETEIVVAGSWAASGDAEPVRMHVAEGAARVSLEEDIAGELGVQIGDLVEWDVQGRIVSSVVSSIRSVDWASFQPNFYAVFEAAALEGAPTTWIGIVPSIPPGRINEVQDRLMSEAPNVSMLDVSAVRETVERVSGRVVAVLRALAGIATAGGFLVLLAALLAGRFRRRRESALLKTLGARSRTIRGVLLVEYLVLGGIGAAGGMLLGAGGGVLLLARVLEAAPVVPWSTLGLTWVGLVVLTIGAGWSVSGPVLREPPLVVLREES